MLPFSVTIPATVPQGSEIPEGLMNNPVKFKFISFLGGLTWCDSDSILNVLINTCAVYLQKTLNLTHMSFRPEKTTCRPRNRILDKAEYLLFYGLAVLVDLGHLTVEVNRSHSVAPHSVRLLQTSDLQRPLPDNT